ncbi:MAG: hypothetical protein M9897_00405 [Brumimicrobium sp.]|nr:hypothetical protein [Brumimicrobium sp.]
MLYFSQENSTQKILHEIKYHNGKELGVYMGKMMGERIFNQANYTDIDAIIPVPIHTKKEFIRGYNQSMSIATGIQKTFQVPVVNALYRKTHDASQTKKSQEQRYENVKDKFGVYTNKLQNIHHVLIVDDVLTTGATLESVVKAVLSVHLPIKISIATIAVAHT